MNKQLDVILFTYCAHNSNCLTCEIQLSQPNFVGFMLACSSCYSFSMMHICSVCCSICIKILFSNLRHAGQTHNTLCIKNTRLIKWLWVTQSLNSRASCGKSQSDHSKQACNWSLIALHETWQRLYWLWLLLDIIPTQRMHRRQIWGKGTSNGCSYNCDTFDS